MDSNDRGSVRAVEQSVTPWMLIALRLGLVALLAKPALSKVLTYERSVSFFETLGIPAPAMMVLVAGSIQVVAIALLFVGAGVRLAAVALVPVMGIAIVTAGLDWKNASVLLGAIAILVLETDIAALWHHRNQVLR